MRSSSSRTQYSLSVKNLPPIDVESSSPTKSKTGQLSSVNTCEIFPEWLIKRKDFQLVRFKKSDPEKWEISTICLKPIEQRTPNELNLVVFWLKTTSFGKRMDNFTLLDVAKRLKTKKYDIAQNLAHENVMSRFVFLIFEGKVGIYQSEKKYGIMGPGNCIGDINLDSGTPMQVSIKAETQVTALMLKAQDYISLLSPYNKKSEILNFLIKVPFFCTNNETQLEQLASSALSITLNQDEVLFDIGEEAFQFYIVKEGLIKIEKDVTVFHKQNLPIRKILVNEKKICHTLNTCKELEVFGIEGIMEKTLRNSRAVGKLKGTEVIVIFVKKYNEILTRNNNQAINSICRKKLSTREIKRKVTKELSSDINRINAIFDATNSMPMHGNFSDKKIQKKVTLANGLLEDFKMKIKSKIIFENHTIKPRPMPIANY
jgi:CRP-like cAMP-binding protein